VAEDRRQTKAKYTADRMIPGAYDGETVTRRRLMVIGANGAGAVAAAAFLLPALGFALGPVFEAHPRPWVNVGPVEDFPDDTYVPVTFTIVDGIGEAGKTLAYVRKRNPQIDTDKLPKTFEYEQHVALSTR